MIQIIAGKKGSGKTKRLIDLTNSTAKEAVHDVIFLDDDNRYMFDVDHKVRFINAADYHVLRHQDEDRTRDGRQQDRHPTGNQHSFRILRLSCDTYTL